MKRVNGMRIFWWVLCALCLVVCVMGILNSNNNPVGWTFTLLGGAAGSAVMAVLTGCLVKDVKEEIETMDKRIRELEKKLWDREPGNRL